eukprot:TRINITY_DN5080_c0_g1_i1.p1 TRINITY_DN5080_c0_g1~~TRINITY_DN5080_c0_g1_i1.p1  ORF type:complete len:300 (+),score=33.86 TRINITY_DN5080_c0_g1_i1:56-901(+)
MGIPTQIFGYNVKAKIGKGGCGDVYKGINPKTGREVAIKIAPVGDLTLPCEAEVYRMLPREQIGFPKMHLFGLVGGYNVMVLDLLDVSLSSVFKKLDGSMCIEAVLKLGKKILKRVELLHSTNHIHRDLKPENIMFSNDNELYLIDFGLSKPFIDPCTNGHIDCLDADQSFSGSPDFASTNAHSGHAQSRRDDIEALGYILLYLTLGRLPWQGLGGSSNEQKLSRISEVKRKTPISSFSSKVHPAIIQIISYARCLSFKETPNYSLIESWLTAPFGPAAKL